MHMQQSQFFGDTTAANREQQITLANFFRQLCLKHLAFPASVCAFYSTRPDAHNLAACLTFHLNIVLKFDLLKFIASRSPWVASSLSDPNLIFCLNIIDSHWWQWCSNCIPTEPASLLRAFQALRLILGNQTLRVRVWQACSIAHSIGHAECIFRKTRSVSLTRAGPQPNPSCVPRVLIIASWFVLLL